MHRLPRQLAALAALAMLSACSGAGSPFGAGSNPSQPAAPLSASARPGSDARARLVAPPIQRGSEPRNAGPTFIDAEVNATGATHVFVSDAASSLILIYTEAGKKIGQIAGISYPGTLAADTAENLYVVTQRTVDILKKPYDKKPLVLHGTGDGVAVSNAGLVAVSTIVSQSDGPGSVAFYRKGALDPCKTISAFTRTYFAGFDAAGDLFIDGSDSNGNFVVGEIIGGCNATSVRALTFANSIEFPGDIAVDTNDHIAIGDQEASAIYTYAQPKNGSLGSPLETTTFSASDLLTFVLANQGHDFWGIDVGLAQANEFAFPKGGASIRTLDAGGNPSGVAVTPLVKP